MTATDRPADRVEQLIALTERLGALLAAQAKAFEQRRPHDAAGQMEEVARLANLYRHETASLRADPALAASAPPALRTRLARAIEAFDAILARHGRALHAAKTITEGIVRAVAEKIACHRGQT